MWMTNKTQPTHKLGICTKRNPKNKDVWAFHFRMVRAVPTLKGGNVRPVFTCKASISPIGKVTEQLFVLSYHQSKKSWIIHHNCSSFSNKSSRLWLLNQYLYIFIQFKYDSLTECAQCLWFLCYFTRNY